MAAALGVEAWRGIKQGEARMESSLEIGIVAKSRL